MIKYKNIQNWNSQSKRRISHTLSFFALKYLYVLIVICFSAKVIWISVLNISRNNQHVKQLNNSRICYNILGSDNRKLTEMETESESNWSKKEMHKDEEKWLQT